MKQTRMPYSVQCALWLVLACGLLTGSVYAQQADAHRQAAASYRQAATQSSGARRSCYLQWADYEDCQAARFGSNRPSRCSQPTCSFTDNGSGGESSPDNSGTVVNESSSDEAFENLRNTITEIMESRIREGEERMREEEERERRRRARTAAVAAEEDAEWEEKTARNRARRADEESEEGERARERARLYKAQRAREKAVASVQTSDVCGWKGLTWFGDRNTVPTLEQLRAANGGSNATLSGDGWLILKIRSVTNDGKISGTTNGRAFTGSINTKRQIWLVSGEKNVDYDEIWGQFSEDGRVITGKWINITLNKQSRGVFALEAECKR